MAGIGTTEKALQNAAKFAPLMGKAFIQVFIAFRLMLAWKLHKVFKDSEKHLECDVETIGCSRMCHNWFYPIALERYWQFQVFCVALPSIIFIAYKSKVDLHIKQALKIKKKVDAEIEKLRKEDCEEKGNVSKKNKDDMSGAFIEYSYTECKGAPDMSALFYFDMLWFMMALERSKFTPISYF